MSNALFWSVWIDGVESRKALQYSDLMDFINGRLRNCIVQRQHIEIKPFEPEKFELVWDGS